MMSRGTDLVEFGLKYHAIPCHTIPYHRFISGNKAHTNDTKIKQEDKKTENQ